MSEAHGAEAVAPRLQGPFDLHSLASPTQTTTQPCTCDLALLESWCPWKGEGLSPVPIGPARQLTPVEARLHGHLPLERLNQVC